LIKNKYFGISKVYTKMKNAFGDANLNPVFHLKV